MDAPLDIEIDGHAGYYAGGMNKHANITVHGNAGPGVAENMMSGIVRVEGLRLRRPRARPRTAACS